MDSGRERMIRKEALESVVVLVLLLCGIGWGGIEKALAGTTVVSDPRGEQWNYVFEDNLGVENLVRKESQTDGKGVSQEFDERNNLVSSTDEEGRTTTFQYNAYNQLVSKTAAFGTVHARTTSYTYVSPAIDLHSVVTTSSVFTGSSRTVTTQYDMDLNVVSIKIEGFDPSGNPVSRINTYEYNDRGQVTKIDGPRTNVADVTRLEYYECDTGAECGQLASVTNALGHTTSYDAYDANGRLLQSTDPNGITTTYTYTPRGWVESITRTTSNTDTRTTTYEYDGAGQLLSVTTPDGVELAYTYDAAHDLRRITDNLGNTVEYSYDLKGNRTREDTKNPDETLVRRIERAYDIRDFVVSLNNGQGETEPGSITTMARDAVGNLVSVTDPKQNSPTLHQYDPLDRLTQTLDSLSGLTNYEYDVQDNLTRVVAPNGAVTEYDYDDLGNMLEERSADRGTVTRTYDSAGNVATETDARGVTVSFEYDALNRLISIDYPGTQEDVTFHYDDLSQPDTCLWGIGRLCARTDNGGTKTKDYDPWGNVSKLYHDVLGETYLMSYQYDDGDRVIGMTYPGGRSVELTRDEIGRVTDMTTTVDGQATQVVSNRTYRSDGLNNSQMFGNGLAEIRQYDLQGRLTNQVVANPPGRFYEYDDNGNLVRLTDSEGERTYSYDPLDRLVGAQYDSTTLAYQYDPNGNRLSLQENGQSTSYAYEPSSNRLQQIGEQSVYLDPAGNTLSGLRSNQSYEYNESGRLARVVDNSSEVARYEYDSRGLRVAKITPDKTTVFHYGLQGKLLAESTPDGSVLREYLYVGAQPVAMIASATDEAGPAELTTPIAGSTLNETPVRFEWEVGESVVDRVLLRVGSTEGARDLFDADVTGLAGQDVDVPLKGGELYVSLYSFMEGEWITREYVFEVTNGGTEYVAVLTDPADGSVLSAAPTLFEWTVDQSAVDRVLLRMGTTPGGRDLFDSDVTGRTSQYVDVPLNGNDIHVTLYSLVDGHWTTRQYSFSTVVDGSDDVATLVFPAEGGTLDTTPVQLQWAVDETLVQRVLLRIGTSPATRDLFDSDVTGRTMQYADIPLDGNTVYVTLYSFVDGHWASRQYSFPTSAGGTQNVASLTSPGSGSSLIETPVRFEWMVDASIVDRVLLRIGTTPRSRNLFDSDVSDITSQMVDLPLDGNDVHVTLFSLIDGHWTTREYLFETIDGGNDNVAILTSPAIDTAIDTTPSRFEWSVDGTIVERVLLRIGTTIGGRDLFDADVSDRSMQNVDLPLNGEDLHVMLYSLVDDHWTTREYVFATEIGGTEDVAVLTTPESGEILTGTPVSFSWTVDSSVVERVLLRIGTEPRSRDLFDADVSDRLDQLVDLPLDGEEVFVTLYSYVDGHWTTREYVFTTTNGGSENVATLTSPVAGTVLSTTPVAFHWSVDETVADRVLLRIGTYPGARDLFDTDVSGSTTQYVDLPLDGNDVHVSLYTLVDGHWTTRQYTFSRSDGGDENVAVLASPIPGSTLSSTPARFEWAVDESVTERVLLRIGTTPRGRGLFDTDVSGDTDRYVDIPLSGENIYVTLYSFVDRHWTTREYVFPTTSSGTDNVATLTAPEDGATIAATPTLLEWAVDDTVVDRVLLRIGSTQLGRNILDEDVTGDLGRNVELTLDGADVHITLYSEVDGHWTTRSYTLQTSTQGGQ